MNEFFFHSLGEAISYSKSNRSKTFILKPDQGAQGRGIWLTKNLKVICPTDRMICQVYINKVDVSSLTN